MFGMDINDSFLRLAKIKKAARGFALQSFAEAPIKEGIVKEGVIMDKEALVKIIRQACKKVVGKKLHAKHVVLSLPEEKSFSQVIQMPRMTSEELVSAVPFEAENYIPIPIEKVYLDFEKMPAADKVQGHTSVLINAVPKLIVDAYVECFKEAGLVPYALEVESQAITRALVKRGSVNPPLIIIDFGVANTDLIIFLNGGIRFTCSIPISSSQLTQAIADTFKVSVTRAEKIKIKQGLNKKGEQKYNVEKAVSPILHELVLQIKKYINFYYGHASAESSLPEMEIEKIILCGGGANLKKMPAFLHKELKIPVELGNPFSNILAQKNGKSYSLPEEKILSFTTALGLALRAVAEEN